MKPKLLDLFSCAGLGADGYAEHFDVFCVDNDPRALRHNPHPSRCADVLEVLADEAFVREFDLVHYSAPCQGFSATRCLADAQGKGRGRAVDLLHPVRDRLTAIGVPWVAENVTRSPVRSWPGVVRLCGSAFGLKVERHRWFAPSPGLALAGTDCRHADAFDVDLVSGKPRPWGVYYAKGDSIPSGGRTALSDEHGHEVMGVTSRRVPWRYLCEGLPPAYTEHLGRQLAAQLGSERAA